MSKCKLTWMFLICTSASVVAPGCQEEAVEPSPTGGASSPAGGAGAGGASGGGGAGGAPLGPRVRDVFMRNPMGSPPENLFVDGDFELSIVPEEATGGQYGWLTFSAGGSPKTLVGETGGICRSGLRCARVDAGRLLFGRGAAAANDAEMQVSIWVKALEAPPNPEDPCDLGLFLMVACDTFEQLRTLGPADAPDAQGWCELSAEMDGQKQSVCLYSDLLVDILVDNATLLPTPQGQVNPLPAPMRAEAVQTPAQHARMSNLREVLRRRTLFGRPLPEPDR